MEVLIILIAVGIIGYVVYQNLPSSKFLAGKKLYETKKHKDAVSVFENLLGKHPESPSMLALCYIEIGKQLEYQDNLNYFQKAIDVSNRVNTDFNQQTFLLAKAKACYLKADVTLKHILNNQSVGESEFVDQLHKNLDFIETSAKGDIQEDFKSLQNKHLSELYRYYFAIANRFEYKKDFPNAISAYSKAMKYQERIYKTQLYTDALTRKEICRVKIGESSFDFEEINKATKNLRTDFYYRYILNIIKKDRDRAEEFTVKYLPKDEKNTKQLLDYFYSFKKKAAKNQIDTINTKLEDLFNNQFPLDRTKAFYVELDKTIPSITSVFPELKPKLEEIKPSLFNKLLISSIENQDYGNAINLIAGFPNFWTVPELLKNLGICCFGITNQGKLTNTNYEFVISSWLSAVYSDEVILKSLEATSWDDEYTFSLADSIGSKYGNHSSLPENANYDDITESNISIGATQRELLAQFENAINANYHDEGFSKRVHEFYSNEKNAIEKVISIVANEILFATPYFARKYPSVAEEIISQLDDDYSEYYNEEALEAGVPYYNSNNNSTIYSGTVGEYHKAVKIKEEFMTSLKTLKTDKLIEINKDTDKKETVNKYGQLKEVFEEEIFSFFNSMIEEDDENEKLIAPLAQSINLLKPGNKLRYQYSNFVTNLTVAKVNEDKMDNFKALQNMKNAYISKSDISRVCKNLIAIIRMNLFDIINDRTNKASDIYKILDEIKKSKSATYKNHCSELTTARRELLAQFPAEARTLILAGNNLSTEGLKIRKALQYMVEMGDGDDFTDLSDLFKK